jgi:hypothetical protein
MRALGARIHAFAFRGEAGQSWLTGPSPVMTARLNQ